MSSKERIGIILDVDAEVSKAKGNIGSLSKIFDGIGGSKGNQLRDLLSDISAEYEKLANESGKTMSKVGDFTKAEKSSERLSQLLRRLDKEISGISRSSKGDLSKFFPPEVADRVKKASEAVKTYNTIIENSSKKKGAIGAAADEYEKQEKAVRKAAEALKDLQDIQKGNSKKQVVNEKTKSDAQTDWENAKKKVTEYSNAVRAAQQKVDEFKKSRPDLVANNSLNYSKFYKPLRDELEQAKTALAGARTEAKNFQKVFDNMVVVTDLDEDIKAAEQALQDAQNAAMQFKTNLDNITASEFLRAFDEAKKKLEGLSGIDLSEIVDIDGLTNLLQRFNNEGVQGVINGLNQAGVEIRELGDANAEAEGKIRDTTEGIEAQNRAMEDVNGIKNRILQFFSLTNAMQLGRQAIRETIETVKELDAAMTETAVVTNFSVGDMWDQLPEYTDMAREYGVAIKGVYDASTLYYQQGLNQEQTMQLTGETLKMARIAGLEYADATDLMTAALRGFNMELNETNATHINDVYSELAAITAADTEEIATAMTKTASIASSANMEFETTAALLSQIIETTREPAETAGTAMKTIIARFTEMKEATSDIVNIDGEEVSVNKVESALKSAGVALRDAKGEFRDLDDVFLELSSKWDGLDIMTQRYIATMAAGSRQQSRFIAMMQNYDRTMELVDAAYNSGGASALQFGKTQESLETKLNNLKSAWQEFLMGLANSDAIKTIIDVLTKLINVLNDATTGVGGFSTFALRMFSIITTFKIGKGFFNKIFSNIDTEMFKGGQKAGKQVGLGLQKGINDSVKQVNKGVVSSLRSKIVNVFTKTKMIPKIPVDFDWDNSGNIDASKFAQTITKSLASDKIVSQIDDIGATLENSINAQLDAHGLYDEGADWVKTLIDGFKENMQKEGANLKTEVANVAAGVRAELSTPVDSSDPDAEQKQQKKQMALNDFDKNGGIIINKEAIPITEQVQANVTAIGSALSAASMTANLLTSSFVDLGMLSEDSAKGIENIGSGLAAAGTAMMLLKTAADAFKISCLTNPVIIGIAAVVAGISIMGGIFSQMAEDAKQANEELVNTAKESQEEVEAAKQEIDAYNELLNAYNETGEGAEDLQKRKEELIETLELEKYGVNALTSSYEEVAAAAEKAREEILATNMENQKAGLQGATSQAETEGSKPGWGGAGWINGGSGFEIDIGGSDSYDDLVTIFQEVAKDKEIEGLTYTKNSSGNLQIGGLDNSPEGRRLWMELMSQVLSDYGTSLSNQGKDSGKAWGYVAMSEYWGKVGGYYEDANASQEGIEGTELEQAEIAAQEAAAKETNINSMQDFDAAVDRIINSLSGYTNLTDEQKQGIAISALQGNNKQLQMYGKAYTQILRIATDETSQDFLDFIAGLNDTDIRLIANLDVQIDPHDTVEEIREELTNAELYDAIWGQAKRAKNLGSYGDKLLSGEEISDEDKEEMEDYILQDHGIIAYHQWQEVQDEAVSVQLEFLREQAEQKQKDVDEKIKAYYQGFDDQISKNMEYGTEAEGKSAYSQDLEEIAYGKSMQEYIEESYKAEKEISINDEELKDYKTYEPGYKHGEGNLEEHINSYNYWLQKKKEADFLNRATANVGLWIYGLTSDQRTQIIDDPNNELYYLWKEQQALLTESSSYFGEGVHGLTLEEIVDKYYQTEHLHPEEGLEAAKNNMIGEIDYAFQDEKEDVADYEKSIEKVYIDFGIDPAIVRSDLNQDGAADFYDVKDFLASNKEAIKYAKAAEDVVNAGNGSAFKELYDTTEGRFLTVDEAKESGAFERITFENSTEQLRVLQGLVTLEEAEKNGYKIRIDTDEDGIKKAVVAVEDLRDEEGNPIEMELELDEQALDDLENRIDEIDGSLITLEFEVKKAEIDALEAVYQSTLNEAENLNHALDLMNEKYQVSPENIEELRDIAPELLVNAQNIGEGWVQLDRAIVNSKANEYAENLTEASGEYIDVIDDQNETMSEQAAAYAKLRQSAEDESIDVKQAEKEKAKQFIETALAKEKQCAAEAVATEKNTNNSIEAAKASSLAQTTSLSEINTAVQATAKNYDTLWKIARGELTIDEASFESVTISDGSADAYKAFVSNTSAIKADQIYDAAQLKDKDGDGNLTKEILDAGIVESEEDAAAVDAYVQIFDYEAEEYEDSEIKNNANKIVEQSKTDAAVSELLNGPKSNKGGSGGGSGSGSNSQKDYEQESDRIKKKIDEIDSAIKDLADNDIVDMSKVNELIEQKIALQKEYKKSLEDELMMLDQALPQLWSEVVKAGNNKYIEYDKDTKMYVYTDAFYEDFFKDGIPIENEQMGEIQDQLNGLNQIGSDQLAKQVAIKELIDNLVRNQGEDYNAERTLKGRERRQTVADAEEGLIGRLPEEIQGPLMMMNTAEDAMLEYQEIQANKVLAENMQQELDAAYAGVPDAVKEYMTFDEYSGYGIDLNKIYSNIEGQEAQDDMINRVMQNAEILNTKYDALYDVLEQLDGGKIQDAFHKVSKASKDLAKDLKKDEHAISKAFREFGDRLGFGSDKLEGFGLKIEETLGEMEFKGITDEEGAEKIVNTISKSKIGQDIFSEEGIQGIQKLLVGGKGSDLAAPFMDVFGDLTGFAGDMMSFDMMNIGLDMFDNAKNMIDQGKQMVEKIIGYITQATQVIVDAWTNREDYLYNFLKVIEKHLQEYEKLQRYQNQLEKGRTSSVAEIRATYDEQWKSLQLQLEEQTERLEIRQEELDRSRWNPFSLISGWDPTTDTLYENRSVKFAWDLLIGFSSMLPMGLGAFGQQLNQLYEDYDQRVQNSYEDRLAAEQALLDIEDERLELVKYGSEEATEFENKILEAMVQKEQEQIDELTRLNDAITDANSKLISTLQDNLDKMRQDRENEKKEEELGEKERRLAYLRQDTSGANMMEIKKLEEQLEEEHEDYTDTLIDQKISELEKQNELAAEQRQQQIDLLQGQLDYAEKYGLYWDAIYGMLYTIDENGNAVLNPENFDLDGNIRENSQLAQMLGTFSDRLGMSVWSSVLDNEEMKRLGRYYGFFIGNNGVTGNWRHQWALDDPGANDPNYAQPEVEIPDGIWGVLYKLEMLLRERSINNNPDLINRAGRAKQWFRNGVGNLFGIEDWAEYKYEYTSPAHVQPTIAMDMKETSDSIKSWFANGLGGIIKDSKGSVSVGGTQNNGDQNITNYFNIGTVGENISLDDMVDKVSAAIRGMFTTSTNTVRNGH